MNTFWMHSVKKSENYYFHLYSIYLHASLSPRTDMTLGDVAVHFEGLVAGCSVRGHGPKGNFRFRIYNFAQTVRAAVKVGSQPRSNVN